MRRFLVTAVLAAAGVAALIVPGAGEGRPVPLAGGAFLSVTVNAPAHDAAGGRRTGRPTGPGR
jgi:hypothetical protein